MQNLEGSSLSLNERPCMALLQGRDPVPTTSILLIYLIYANLLGLCTVTETSHMCSRLRAFACLTVVKCLNLHLWDLIAQMGAVIAILRCCLYVLRQVNAWYVVDVTCNRLSQCFDSQWGEADRVAPSLSERLE